MAATPEHRWLLLDTEPHVGWRRWPRPEPRMHLRPLSGPDGWTLFLESRDVPGRRAIEPVGPVPEPVIYAAVVDSRMIVDQWLDDCIDTWGWISAAVEGHQVVLKFHQGTEREFVVLVELPVRPITRDLIINMVQILPRRPRLVIETSVGVQVVGLADVVFTVAPVAPVLHGRVSR